MRLSIEKKVMYYTNYTTLPEILKKTDQLVMTFIIIYEYYYLEFLYEQCFFNLLVLLGDRISSKLYQKEQDPIEHQ